MINLMNILDIRRKLGRTEWQAPIQIVPGQWSFKSNVSGSIIVYVAPYPMDDGEEVEWVHASISRRDYMPTYEDLVMLYKAVFNDGWAYQIFAPSDRHINIHNYALHLYGRLDGKNIHPDF